MINLGSKSIYLACGYTDMRKSINGLASIVEGSFKLSPYSPSLYVFCNRNRDRIKVLEWDGDGFWLYFKRLEQGHFKWPTEDSGGVTMNLNHEEFICLLGAPKMIQRLEGKTIKPGAAV